MIDNIISGRGASLWHEGASEMKSILMITGDGYMRRLTSLKLLLLLEMVLPR